MFKTNTIRSRVMKAINNHIDNAEKEYVAECEVIDRKAEESKVVLADKMVESIIGKILTK